MVGYDGRYEVATVGTIVVGAMVAVAVACFFGFYGRANKPEVRDNSQEIIAFLRTGSIDRYVQISPTQMFFRLNDKYYLVSSNPKGHIVCNCIGGGSL